ncbi:MAG: hypothetical protein HDQ98_00545 [Lachnospiraceae bacterium]|nr:hypothetical protein [Lachnospiraceae bacterium]
MEQMNSRRNEIFQYLQEGMEKCFYKSCQSIQTEIENGGDRIWSDLKAILEQILMHVADMQKKNNKGSAQYLVFSFLNSSIHFEELELRIEVLDDGFYLDEQEAAGYYCPQFLQAVYLSGVECLCWEASEKFVRLQNQELFEIKKEYAKFYNALLCQMIKSLCGMIMGTVVESGIKMTEDFKIIYGEYMGKAVVLGGGGALREERT